MIKKTITFKDLDGKPLTEDFWFNLSPADIAKMELSQAGGSLTEYLKRIVADSDGAAIIDTFEKVIARSYGLRNEDNKGFDKSDEISRKFMSTDAYSVLFMELVTDADASSAFIRGVVPESMNLDSPVLPPALVPTPEPVFEGLSAVDMVSTAVETAKTSDMTLDEMKAAIRKAEENKPE